MHAPHAAHAAPKRTGEHYRSRGKDFRVKDPNSKYWAVIEEMDAAIGQILEVLDYDKVCDMARKPCNSNADCSDPGDSCVTVSGLDNTVVLFASDQGRPGSGYGNPMLRAGKETVYDGGARVGMLARGPGIATAMTEDTKLASQVDSFPTIADIAGFPIDPTSNKPTLKVCAGTSKGRLNCLDKDEAGGPLGGSKVLGVFNDLYCRLESLERCVREEGSYTEVPKINDPRYDCEDPDRVNTDLTPPPSYGVDAATQQCERAPAYAFGP